MKKKNEPKISEALKISREKLKASVDNSLRVKNPNQDLEKTQDNELEEPSTEWEIPLDITGESEPKIKIIQEMDEIIKNNDKFETIRVIMEILCKELGISKESQFPTIAGAVQGVVERYYKSMEDWKNLRNQSKTTNMGAGGQW